MKTTKETKLSSEQHIEMSSRDVKSWMVRRLSPIEKLFVS